jgi:polygalacturonase
VHPLYCDGVTIRDATIVTRGPNTDGVDPESCRNVLIERCYFSTGDDCIAIKSGRDRDGRIVGRPCENIIVRDCLMTNGHGGVAIGSEQSGGVRNVRVTNCDMRGTDRIIRIKSQRGRGGVVEDIVVENVRGRNNLQQAIELTLNYSKAMPPEPFSERTPVFRNITFRNVTCDGTPQAISIDGIEESLISDITFDHVVIRAEEGAMINCAENIRFINSQIVPRAGPPIRTTASRGVTVDGRPVATEPSS